MIRQANAWLVIAGSMNALASLIHVGCIVAGPSWYRFFGAPEPLIRAVENGDPTLDWITAGIAGILAIWSAYAFSGAGLIRRLPLVRTALVAITTIYLARGLLIVPVAAQLSFEKAPGEYWSSVIVLLYGIVHAVGTWRAWPQLSARG